MWVFRKETRPCPTFREGGSYLGQPAYFIADHPYRDGADPVQADHGAQDLTTWRGPGRIAADGK